MKLFFSLLGVAALLVVSSCGETVNGGAVDANLGQTDGQATPDAAKAVLLESSCPANTFASRVDAEGKLVCAPMGELAKGIVQEQCTLIWGWRDSCNGCVSEPSKWGLVTSTTCSSEVGTDGTCTSSALGDRTVKMLGINTDGDVNRDDKFYIGLQCEKVADVAAIGPCAPGQFLSSVSATRQECVSGKQAVSRYIRSACHVYLGWRDSCNGCTLGPSKWGRVSSLACENGQGADSTCISSGLLPENFPLFGLNVDGDVNGDDTFYLGFQCEKEEEEESETLVRETCPQDLLVTSIRSDGMIGCSSPSVAARQSIANSCQLYLGWRDSCNGCLSPPSKWGHVGIESCDPGVGVGNVCGTPVLNSLMVPMLGVNTDGDVDGDDKFYLGLSCE